MCLRAPRRAVTYPTHALLIALVLSANFSGSRSLNISLQQATLHSGDTCHQDGGQEYCSSLKGCLPDGHCERCAGYLTEDIDTHECIDRTVFGSHALVDAIAAVIWFVGAGLAMSAGVGGGGIFVPLGVILLRFASKPSTGLSQASIFGASLAGFIINIRRRHPLADRPVIDLDMALFLAPMEMAGALLGIMIQKVLPVWAVIVLMAVILGFTAYKTFTKGFKTLKKELAARKKVQVSKADDSPADRTLTEVSEVHVPETGTKDLEVLQAVELEQCGTESKLDVSPKLAWEESASNLPTAQEWLARDARIPIRSCVLLLVMWAFLVVILVIKGGKGTTGVVEYCSPGYWICTAAGFIWLICFSLFTGHSAVSKTIQKSAVAYPFVDGDVIWTWSKFRFYCFITFLAGVVAGLIGIGGGMVLGPMMLQLGILPQVSSATTATMIVLTSSVAALMYVTAGTVPVTYAVFFFTVAFIGAFVGKTYIDHLVKRCQLTAIIILILASIISFASLMMTINGFIIYGEKNWAFEGFYDFC